MQSVVVMAESSSSSSSRNTATIVTSVKIARLSNSEVACHPVLIVNLLRSLLIIDDKDRN